MTGVCVICGGDLAGRPVLYRISGWEELRRQGGANKIVGRRQTGEVAHKSCVMESYEQTALDLDPQARMFD